MKFMVQMNVKKGPYQMQGWSQEDVKRMVGFMNKTNAELKAAGQWVVGEGLVSPEEARLVTANQDGGPSVTDGPFAESKEFIAGFWIIEVKDADEAYRIAARISLCPGPGGKPLHMPLEVRAVGQAPA
ncbi:MAG TPA: YciI family protein [Vicinamibacterales bacterium]|nr:YciI family protein [Vicinamibacterales bacterium]